MSIDQAESLKTELTDKWVVVNNDVPELRRFAGLTGKVKTVNMNCQALVEFNGPADIGWYDINPAFLSVVDAPAAKEKPKADSKDKPAAKAAPKKPAGGESPLDLLRKQGAAKPAGEKKAAADGEKKLSPLEMARQQGAAGKSAAPAAGGEKKLSPLELARQQGAAKAEAEASAPEAVEETAPEPVEEAAPAKSEAPAPAGGGDLSTEEILELCRKQGAFEG